MRTSDERYRRLFETARDGILILDADTGEILDANPCVTELLGCSRAWLLTKQLWQIGLFASESENEAAVGLLRAQGYVRCDHLSIRTSGGQRADIELVGTVSRAGSDRVAQCTIRDIGDRVQRERQTREQFATLLALHRRQEEFLAILTHELRNPLAPILNAVELLRLEEERETPIQHRARTIIARQTQHLSHLIDDLMEAAHITTGKLRVRFERVDLRQIVQGAVETIEPVIFRHQHELTVVVPDAAIWLYADPTRLEQVVVNLLANAARYTEDGGRIWLTVEAHDEVCLLRVCDSGIGIASELLPRIFDLFTQSDSGRDRSAAGLGVGLALVRRLTELHGGTVEVFSVPGLGSEFVVRLPRDTSQGETARTVAPAIATSIPRSVRDIDHMVNVS